MIPPQLEDEVAQQKQSVEYGQRTQHYQRFHRRAYSNAQVRENEPITTDAHNIKTRNYHVCHLYEYFAVCAFMDRTTIACVAGHIYFRCASIRATIARSHLIYSMSFGPIAVDIPKIGRVLVSCATPICSKITKFAIALCAKSYICNR
jgi:hypothetical protein